MNSPLILSVSYDHQYLVSVASSSTAGGSVEPASGWYNAGTQLNLSESSTAGWQAEGWRGNGSGSYSGDNQVTLITISSSVREQGVFYPGLTITAPPAGGSVQYSFASTVGSVDAGRTVTVYVEPGTSISLTANPSTMFYSFDKWSGSTNGSSTHTSISVNSPSSLSASFGYNLETIGGIMVVVVIGAALASLMLLRRKPHATS
jgi:hypothetical protein